MNIDFIKWKAEKAGFKIVKDKEGDEYIYYTAGQWCGIECIEGDEVLNGHLSQRAIEGVNEHDKNIVIVQDDTSIEVVSYNFTKEYYICDGIDQAKESALMYICEQELDKNKEVK